MSKSFIFKSTPTIFSPGRISSLLAELDGNSKKPSKFTEQEMARIPEIFANTYEYKNLLNIPLDEIETPEGNKVAINDFYSLVLILYKYSRGQYYKFNGPQYRDTSFSAGTPLPLLGYKRYHGKCYSEFMPKDPENIEEVFYADLRLGRAFASTLIDGENVLVTPDLGLCRLKKDIIPNVGLIQMIRKSCTPGNQNMGTGTSATAFKEKDKDEKRQEFIDVYNNASKWMRLLLTQRWIWYPTHRTTDMITDWRDWGNTIPSVDVASTKAATEDSVLKVGFGSNFKMPDPVTNNTGKLTDELSL